MPDWISNGPISQPINLPDVQVDVDLNGMKFNYNIGVFFTPSDELPISLKLPPMFEEPM